MSNDILEIPQFFRDLQRRDKENKPKRSVKERLTKVSEIDGGLLEQKNGFWWPVKSGDVAKESKKDRDKNLMDFLSTLVNTGLKKKPLIAKFREKFPKLSSSQICRFVNNQLKLKVIEIDKKYKTKPIVVKGRYWRN